MRDAQPEAVAGANHALPIDIADNAAEPGATLAAEQPPEPQADLESAVDQGQDVESNTEAVAEAVAEPESDRDAPEEPEPAAKPAATEPEPDETADLLAITHPADRPEPIELIEMSEPVELAEPVEEAPPRRRGHGLLIGVLFLVAAIAIIGGAFAIVSHLTHGFKKPVIITYKKSAIFSLRTGECIDPNGQQAASLVPCTKAHGAEVFATFTLPKSTWPGAAEVAAAARSGCDSRLTGYLNPQLAISLSTMFVYPDAVAWRTGTRKVICEVRATSGNLTGSVRGAAAKG